jgi:hypothetical protein
MYQHADTFMKSRIPAKAFQEILKKYNISQISRIADTVGMANNPATREVLAETVLGRRALQHIQDNDWREVMRDHDFVAEANVTAIDRQISVDDPTLTRFHKRAEWFILPPGVKPLTTREEFNAEGKQMGHCVAHYYGQRKSWCFSFRAPDGERATLELSLDGNVNQFYGPGNDPAKPSTRALLTEFLQQNKKNIQDMKKGTFPPQAVNRPKSDDPLADLEE